jgi:hypothetical protein
VLNLKNEANAAYTSSNFEGARELYTTGDAMRTSCTCDCWMLCAHLTSVVIVV